MRRKETTMSTEITTTSETATQPKRKTKAAEKAKAAKATKQAGKATKSAKAPRSTKPKEASKKDRVLELLRRKEGATIAEIAKATDWQNHSIRGFISGNVTKKMGLAVESSKNDAGERTYRIAK